MPRRSAMAVLAVSVAMVVFAAPASACNDPHLQAVEPSTVAPGDDVSYTIVYTSPGAKYVVTINGDYQVDAGTADGAYVAGSFKMPDLGRAATPVTVEAVVTHDDIAGGSIPSSRTIQYQPRATASNPSAGAQQPEPAASAPAAEPEPAAAPAPQPGGGAVRPGPAAPRPPQSGKPAARPRPRAPHSPVHEPATRHTFRTAATRTTAPASAPGLPGRSAAPLVHAAAPGHALQRRHSVAATSVHARIHPTAAEPAAAVARTRLPADRGVSDETAAAIAVVILVALLGGVGRAGIRAARRRPPPVLPELGASTPDPIEAELQELLSEEAAATLSATDAGAPSGVP